LRVTALQQRTKRAGCGKRTTPVYALTVARGGPKFKETAADAPRIANHGVNGRLQILNLSHATMGDLAEDISRSYVSERPVLDKTDLSEALDIKLEATPEFRLARNP
jgi:uncharacterized protein (TIGR03435 family)